MNHSSTESSLEDTHDHLTPSVQNLWDELDETLFRLGRLMTSRQSEFQKLSGLHSAHFFVLKLLTQSGSMRVSDIAASMGVTNPAVSMFLQCLEEEDLIAREHSEDDRRVVLVSCTDAGRKRLENAEQFRRVLMQHMTADLSEDDVASMVRILGTIADTMASPRMTLGQD